MPDLTGQYLGQYQILSRIAKGSVSTIYKAYQPKLDRHVAVKVLSAQVIDEEDFLERFSQEALAIAQLDHPNIVPVYDFDRVDDTVYLVMKYVEGGTLKELMGANRPLDLNLAVELAAQIGRALAYAHKRGVVHRDVKPSNILLAEGNWALLTDFGLAKMIVGNRRLTRSGIGMGTPDYMSPEQAQGFPIDPRTDLYSLGATLYEMVTGRVPFEADSSMAVIVKHMTEPPPPPRQHNPALPPAVEDVILTALEKDPDRRYQTAEDFISALVQAAHPSLPKALVGTAVSGVSGVGYDTAGEIAPRLAAPVSLEIPRQPSRDSRPVRVSPPARKEAAPAQVSGIQRFFASAWAHAAYRVALAAAAILLVLLAGALILLVQGLWQSLAATPTLPPPTIVIPSPPPITATEAVWPTNPTDTPTPEPTGTPTPLPTPTANLDWTYLFPGDPVIPGIYARVVRPDGLGLYAEPGLDKLLVATLPPDSIVYVLGGPLQVGEDVWMRVRDVQTGAAGWGLQGDLAAYAVPAQ